MSNFDEFRFVFDHVEKLLDRRQLTTSFYFSVNTGVFAAVGLLVKDSSLSAERLTGSVLLLLCAGFIACWIWRSLLGQYELLLDWWFARLRDMEAKDPDSARLVTREYEEFYAADAKPARRLGMTQFERRLNLVFAGLYVLFAVGIALDWLVRVIVSAARLA